MDLHFIIRNSNQNVNKRPERVTADISLTFLSCFG